jgi:hypothetical protein
MFEQQPRTSLTTKVLSVSAIGMLVGFGTCGLTVLTDAGNRRFWVIAEMGAGLFFLSLLTILGTILIFIVNSIRENFRK